MLKKIIYLIVSGGLLLSGCSLDYEPLNGPSSGSFPASEEEAMAGLYAAYKGLANMTVKETPFPMRINDCISDIGTYRTGAGNQIKAMSSTLTADNTMCEKVYKTVYKIAGRVHLVLDNLDRLRGVIPEDRFNQIKAELLCIRAYYYDLGCQFYGDIPFSEAFQGRNNVLKPKFDTQKEVYTQLFADLDRANSLYDPSRALRYPNKDLMYKGDIAKWRKFTNSLHMRLLMRLQNRDAEMGVSEKLREIVSNPARYPVMASNADNAALFYTNVDPFIGHFGTTTLQSFTSNSHRMAEHLVNLMNNTNDPRLGIYAVQQNNEWTGLVSGYPTTETNATNCAYLNKDVLGDSFQFVKENTMCTLVSYKGSVFSVEAPNFMELEVTATEPGVKGVVTADMLERIAMTPRTAKRLTLTLIQSLREYEARFGEIAVEEKAPEEE